MVKDVSIAPPPRVAYKITLILHSDSESEVWEMMGIAVRMSIDLGLHLVRKSYRRPLFDLTLRRVRRHKTGYRQKSAG